MTSLLLRQIQFDTLHVAKNKQVRHHAEQRCAADVDQGVEEAAKGGDDKTDYQRREDARQVSAEVKQPAGQTAQPFWRHVGN